MSIRFDETCWRGMKIAHPADWELVHASAHGQAAQCAFADRRYERLRVQWRTMNAATNFRKMLEDEAGKKREEGRNAGLMSGQPEGWHGIVEHLSSGSLVHAGRMCEDRGIFIEAALVWPGPRENDLENRVLEGVRLSTDPGRWRAMGISMNAPEGFTLVDYTANTGEIVWRFGPEGKKRQPLLTVKRLAAPRYWLKLPLDRWLENTVDAGVKVKSVALTEYNGHEAAILRGVKNGGVLLGMRGKHILTTQVAWKCPVEERVYHLAFYDALRGGTLDMPSDLKVACCKEAPLQRAARMRK